MPVRKPAAKKTTPAKKATPAPSNAKSNPTRGTATKKSASSGMTEAQVEQVGKLVLAAIKGGDLDHMLPAFDDALTARINKTLKEMDAKAAAKPAASKEKSVSAPPKKPAASASKSLVLTANKMYKIGATPVKLKGAKVKYLKPKPGDDNKVVVELAVDLPGYPKGKRVVLPKSALVAAAR